jgi:plastocyanin
MRASWLGWVLLLATTADAAGAELRVLVTDQKGRPVADAVVGAQPSPGTAMPAPAPARTHTIDQVALTFVPYLEVLHPGDKVVFRNGDRTRHHVYSFSAAKAFEFMLNPGQSSSPLVLDRAGVVAVGCNIHDSMITYLYVTQAPWSARTGADGSAVLSVPDGSYTLRAWHPRLRPGRAEAVLEKVAVGATPPPPVGFKLALLPDTRRQPDRERARY